MPHLKRRGDSLFGTAGGELPLLRVPKYAELSSDIEHGALLTSGNVNRSTQPWSGGARTQFQHSEYVDRTLFRVAQQRHWHRVPDPAFHCSNSIQPFVLNTVILLDPCVCKAENMSASSRFLSLDLNATLLGGEWAVSTWNSPMVSGMRTLFLCQVQLVCGSPRRIPRVAPLGEPWIEGKHVVLLRLLPEQRLAIAGAIAQLRSRSRASLLEAEQLAASTARGGV